MPSKGLEAAQSEFFGSRRFCFSASLSLPPFSVFSDADDASLTSGQDSGRVSGISTRFGHPRGVMQFLPSIRQEHFLAPSDSSYRSRRSSLSRKTSVPEGYLSFPETVEEKSPRLRRRGVVDELYASNTVLDRKGSESIAGVSRFSKLLKSFRSRPTSPDQGPTISWSPYTLCAEADGVERAMDSSLLEADIMLWKKRSRASLRKHDSARNLAAKELYDTEKSFVEGLEFLVTKYMRPLRAPLECTLIEAGLVDKIFYRIPEILAHHQVEQTERHSLNLIVGFYYLRVCLAQITHFFLVRMEVSFMISALENPQKMKNKKICLSWDRTNNSL